MSQTRQFDRMLRKLNLQGDYEAKTRRPFRIDECLVADSGGVHVEAWSAEEGDVAAIVRQRVLRTLEENGIPNTVVEIEARVMTLGSDVYENDNPHVEEPSGRWLAGCWQVYSFRFTPEARGWFEVAADLEDESSWMDDSLATATTGEIRTRLRLV